MNTISTRPRLRRTPEEIQALLDEYRSGDLSLREFALSRQVSRWTLSNWVRRYRAKAPVQPRWIETRPQLSSLNSKEVASVRFPDGLAIELRSGFQAASVAELIKLLRQV